jgi:hypothetical protein
MNRANSAQRRPSKLSNDKITEEAYASTATTIYQEKQAIEKAVTKLKQTIVFRTADGLRCSFVHRGSAINSSLMTFDGGAISPKLSRIRLVCLGFQTCERSTLDHIPDQMSHSFIAVQQWATRK